MNESDRSREVVLLKGGEPSGGGKTLTRDHPAKYGTVQMGGLAGLLVWVSHSLLSHCPQTSNS